MRLGERRTILMWLAFGMILGIVVYFKLWIIDYNISSDDKDFMRREFDLASKEAMDESAEWRLKYDEEVERAMKCVKELIEGKESFQKKAEEAAGMNEKLSMLQKENIGLLDRVESITQELQTLKLNCTSSRLR
ncbi:hypothetical protein GIB67_031007 [Kingdonia uniflora]|uniref:Uncharacterized protein n=1 Tax=Kingdonia uniflora TaxID=39325 RepID=A0A7J7NGN2_9MAGN|nr:hypothetical protein GIB67_031007 [Kingdonia uniflora]